MKKLFEIEIADGTVLKLNPYHILSFETRRGRRGWRNQGVISHPYYAVIRKRQPWHRRIFMATPKTCKWTPNRVYIYGTDDSKPLYRVEYDRPRYAQEARERFENQLEEILRNDAQK